MEAMEAPGVHATASTTTTETPKTLLQRFQAGLLICLGVFVSLVVIVAIDASNVSTELPTQLHVREARFVCGTEVQEEATFSASLELKDENFATGSMFTTFGVRDAACRIETSETDGHEEDSWNNLGTVNFAESHNDKGSMNVSGTIVDVDFAQLREFALCHAAVKKIRYDCSVRASAILFGGLSIPLPFTWAFSDVVPLPENNNHKALAEVSTEVPSEVLSTEVSTEAKNENDHQEWLLCILRKIQENLQRLNHELPQTRDALVEQLKEHVETVSTLLNSSASFKLTHELWPDSESKPYLELPFTVDSFIVEVPALKYELSFEGEGIRPQDATWQISTPFQVIELMDGSVNLDTQVTIAAKCNEDGVDFLNALPYANLAKSPPKATSSGTTENSNECMILNYPVFIKALNSLKKDHVDIRMLAKGPKTFITNLCGDSHRLHAELVKLHESEHKDSHFQRRLLSHPNQQVDCAKVVADDIYQTMSCFSKQNGYLKFLMDMTMRDSPSPLFSLDSETKWTVEAEVPFEATSGTKLLTGPTQITLDMLVSETNRTANQHISQTTNGATDWEERVTMNWDVHEDRGKVELNMHFNQVNQDVRLYNPNDRRVEKIVVNQVLDYSNEIWTSNLTGLVSWKITPEGGIIYEEDDTGALRIKVIAHQDNFTLPAHGKYSSNTIDPDKYAAWDFTCSNLTFTMNGNKTFGMSTELDFSEENQGRRGHFLFSLMTTTFTPNDPSMSQEVFSLDPGFNLTWDSLQDDWSKDGAVNMIFVANIADRRTVLKQTDSFWYKDGHYSWDNAQLLNSKDNFGMNIAGRYDVEATDSSPESSIHVDTAVLKLQGKEVGGMNNMEMLFVPFESLVKRDGKLSMKCAITVRDEFSGANHEIFSIPTTSMTWNSKNGLFDAVEGDASISMEYKMVLGRCLKGCEKSNVNLSMDYGKVAQEGAKNHLRIVLTENGQNSYEPIPRERVLMQMGADYVLDWESHVSLDVKEMKMTMDNRLLFSVTPASELTYYIPSSEVYEDGKIVLAVDVLDSAQANVFSFNTSMSWKSPSKDWEKTGNIQLKSFLQLAAHPTTWNLVGAVSFSDGSFIVSLRETDASKAQRFRFLSNGKYTYKTAGDLSVTTSDTSIFLSEENLVCTMELNLGCKYEDEKAGSFSLYTKVYDKWQQAAFALEPATSISWSTPTEFGQEGTVTMSSMGSIDSEKVKWMSTLNLNYGDGDYTFELVDKDPTNNNQERFKFSADGTYDIMLIERPSKFEFGITSSALKINNEYVGGANGVLHVEEQTATQSDRTLTTVGQAGHGDALFKLHFNFDDKFTIGSQGMNGHIQLEARQYSTDKLMWDYIQQSLKLPSRPEEYMFEFSNLLDTYEEVWYANARQTTGGSAAGVKEYMPGFMGEPYLMYDWEHTFWYGVSLNTIMGMKASLEQYTGEVFRIQTFSKVSAGGGDVDVTLQLGLPFVGLTREEVHRNGEAIAAAVTSTLKLGGGAGSVYVHGVVEVEDGVEAIVLVEVKTGPNSKYGNAHKASSDIFFAMKSSIQSGEFGKALKSAGASVQVSNSNSYASTNTSTHTHVGVQVFVAEEEAMPTWSPTPSPTVQEDTYFASTATQAHTHTHAHTNTVLSVCVSSVVVMCTCVFSSAFF